MSVTEEQRKLIKEFGVEAKKKGIAYDLIFMAGTIAFGHDAYKNGNQDEIMKDLTKALEQSNDNQEFLNYMFEEYINKMED